MKLKYYLRGLGVGIICTAIIMGISLSGNKKEKLTDTEIIERARLLGMVMEEESSVSSEDNNGKKESENNNTGEQKSENKILNQQNPQGEKSTENNDVNNETSNKPENQTNNSNESENQDSNSDASESQGNDSSASGSQDNDSNSNTSGGASGSQNSNSNTSGNQTAEEEFPNTIELEIKKGDFSDVISKKLFQAGLISDASEFNNYVTKKGVDGSLRIGTYHIPIGSTTDEIIEILQGKRK